MNRIHRGAVYKAKAQIYTSLLYTTDAADQTRYGVTANQDITQNTS